MTPPMGFPFTKVLRRGHYLPFSPLDLIRRNELFMATSLIIRVRRPASEIEENATA